MNKIGIRLSYSNVVATLALFLALSGSAVWAAGGLSGKHIKPNSLPGNRLKKNSLRNAKLKRKTLRRNRFAPGTLSGLTVADARARNLPGATTGMPPGPTPVTLSGGTQFKPVAGRPDLLELELRATPVDPDGTGPGKCFPQVFVYVNGVKVRELSALQDLSGTSPDGSDPTISYQGDVLPLLADSGTQTISAKVFGDPNCGPGTSIDSLHITVTQLG
jgi:hypothetical protein